MESNETEKRNPWPALGIFVLCAALATWIALLKLPQPWPYLRLIPLLVGMTALQRRFGTAIMALGFVSYWVVAFMAGFLIGFLK